MIKEDFLHFLWKNNLLIDRELRLSNGEYLEIISPGIYNENTSGPDFFNARLIIGTQQWAGNVEMHISSSNWYAHGHEKDDAYGNVILHVVWQHDIEVFDFQNNIIPTLELKHIVSKEWIQKYQNFQNSSNSFILCEKQISFLEKFNWQSYFEQLFFERFFEKESLIHQLLQETRQDWEAVFFRMLVKYWGGNVNGVIFEQMATDISFSIVRKEWYSQENLEALFLGKLGLLQENSLDTYQKKLFTEFQYQKIKYQLTENVFLPEFFRLRPSNFPTIRASQLANIYFMHQNLFAKCMNFTSLETFCELFKNTTTSNYWKNHYTFGKISAEKTKKIGKEQLVLIWINVVIPMKMAYEKWMKNNNCTNEIITDLKAISAEKNAIISKFFEVKIPCNNAFESQALLQLYKKYCQKNRCLSCEIGNFLLKN